MKDARIPRQGREVPAVIVFGPAESKDCREARNARREVPATVRPDETIASWTRQRPVVPSITLVVVSVGAALLVASQVTGKPREALQASAIALVFVALIGGW